MSKKNVRDLDAASLAGRTVLVRADLNVPLDGTRITDDQRLRATVPTLRLLTGSGARVVLLSHLGRPKGQPDPKYSLAPVAERLGELLGKAVRFIPFPVGDEATAAVASLVDGDVALLENTRFLGGTRTTTGSWRPAGPRWAISS